ncbi:hypothetical protein HDU76_004069, partial [Blyttiomyces sp. JEL0837]
MLPNRSVGGVNSVISKENGQSSSQAMLSLKGIAGKPPTLTSNTKENEQNPPKIQSVGVSLQPPLIKPQSALLDPPINYERTSDTEKPEEIKLPPSVRPESVATVSKLDSEMEKSPLLKDPSAATVDVGSKPSTLAGTERMSFLSKETRSKLADLKEIKAQIAAKEEKDRLEREKILEAQKSVSSVLEVTELSLDSKSGARRQLTKSQSLKEESGKEGDLEKVATDNNPLLLQDAKDVTTSQKDEQAKFGKDPVANKDNEPQGFSAGAEQVEGLSANSVKGSRTSLKISEPAYKETSIDASLTESKTNLANVNADERLQPENLAEQEFDSDDIALSDDSMSILSTESIVNHTGLDSRATGGEILERMVEQVEQRHLDRPKLAPPSDVKIVQDETNVAEAKKFRANVKTKVDIIEPTMLESPEPKNRSFPEARPETRAEGKHINRIREASGQALEQQHARAKSAKKSQRRSRSVSATPTNQDQLRKKPSSRVTFHNEVEVVEEGGRADESSDSEGRTRTKNWRDAKVDRSNFQRATEKSSSRGIVKPIASYQPQTKAVDGFYAMGLPSPSEAYDDTSASSDSSSSSNSSSSDDDHSDKRHSSKLRSKSLNLTLRHPEPPPPSVPEEFYAKIEDAPPPPERKSDSKSKEKRHHRRRSASTQKSGRSSTRKRHQKWEQSSDSELVRPNRHGRKESNWGDSSDPIAKSGIRTTSARTENQYEDPAFPHDSYIRCYDPYCSECRDTYYYPYSYDNGYNYEGYFPSYEYSSWDEPELLSYSQYEEAYNNYAAAAAEWYYGMSNNQAGYEHVPNDEKLEVGNQQDECDPDDPEAVNNLSVDPYQDYPANRRHTQNVDDQINKSSHIRSHPNQSNSMPESSAPEVDYSQENHVESPQRKNETSGHDTAAAENVLAGGPSNTPSNKSMIPRLQASLKKELPQRTHLPTAGAKPAVTHEVDPHPPWRPTGNIKEKAKPTLGESPYLSKYLAKSKMAAASGDVGNEERYSDRVFNRLKRDYGGEHGPQQMGKPKAANVIPPGIAGHRRSNKQGKATGQVSGVASDKRDKQNIVEPSKSSTMKETGGGNPPLPPATQTRLPAPGVASLDNSRGDATGSTKPSTIKSRYPTRQQDEVIANEEQEQYGGESDTEEYIPYPPAPPAPPAPVLDQQ